MAMSDTKFGQWLLKTGADVVAVARVAGSKPKTVRMVAQGQHRPGVDLAKRLIRATCGAVSYEDFYGDPLAELA